jgi:hypothetical protein
LKVQIAVVSQSSVAVAQLFSLGCYEHFMKTSRIILIIGIAHFALWWLSYAATNLAGYNPFTPSSYSVFGRISFDSMSILAFPADSDLIYNFLRQPPLPVLAGFASCIWALCLGGLVHLARQFRHAKAA